MPVTQPASILPTAVATILVTTAAWAAAARPSRAVRDTTPAVTPDAGTREGVATTLGRAWAAYLAGDVGTALAAYRAAAEAEPRAVTPLLGIMYCAAARRDAAAALAAARAVLERDPANPEARRHVALTAYDRGEFAAAEAGCRAMLAAHPEDIEAMALLGWCLLRQARFAEARACFQAVLVAVPGHASAGTGLATLEAAAGERRGATP